MKVGGVSKLVYDLVSDIRKDNVVDSWSWWVRSGDAFRRRRVLSVHNWEGENKSWDGLRPCCWFLGGEHQMLKNIWRGWVAGVV